MARLTRLGSAWSGCCWGLCLNKIYVKYMRTNTSSQQCNFILSHCRTILMSLRYARACANTHIMTIKYSDFYIMLLSQASDHVFASQFIKLAGNLGYSFLWLQENEQSLREVDWKRLMWESRAPTYVARCCERFRRWNMLSSSSSNVTWLQCNHIMFIVTKIMTKSNFPQTYPLPWVTICTCFTVCIVNLCVFWPSIYIYLCPIFKSPMTWLDGSFYVDLSLQRIFYAWFILL